MKTRCFLVALLVFGIAATARAADEVLVGWEFNRDGDAEKWYPAHALAPLVVKGGVLKTRATVGDPYLIASEGHAFDVEANDFQCIEVRLKSNKEGGAEFFWANSVEGRDQGFAAGKERGFAVKGDGKLHTYRVYPLWQGRVSRLRFDPPEDAAIEVDFIRILQTPPSTHEPTSPRWSFADGAGGFLAMNGARHDPTGKGLKVTLSAESASLVSPAVQLQAKEYAYATLHLTAPKPLDAVLCWADTNEGSFPGCNSLPFRINGGEEYLTVKLADTQMWAGDVKRLRIDLMGKEGQQLLLHSLVLGARPEGPAKLSVASLGGERSLYATGDTIRLSLKVSNDGGEEARGLCASLTLGAKAGTLVGPAAIRKLALASGQAWEVAWRVKAARPGVLPVQVSVSAGGVRRPALAATELLITTPIPALRAGRDPVALRQGSVAALGNDRIRLVFIGEGGVFLRARLDLAEGAKTRTMGYLPYLARVAADAAGSPQPVPFRVTGTQADARSASLRLRGVLGAVHVDVAYRVAAASPWVDVSYTLAATKPVALRAFQGPWLWAGEGSFGADQDHALFPGVEWLVKGERSSSTLDVAPPMNVRWAPHPNWVTVPSMAVESGGAIVGLMWDPLQKWDGKQTRPAAVFASPNFVEGRGNHLMGLFLPSIPGYVEKNTLLAKKPYPLRPGAPLTLRASLYARSGADVTAAATTYYERFCAGQAPGAKAPAPSLPPKPRDYAATIDMSMRAYEKILWKPEAKGWMGVLGWAPGRDLGAASFYYTAAQVRRDAPDAGAWREKALSVAAGSSDLTFALRETGRADAALRDVLSGGRAAADAQPEGARYTFQPDEQRRSLGPTGGIAVGISAGPVGRLLDAAVRTGDTKAREAGLKGLAFMDQFDVPRASQVWECPLHEADVLASGQACRAYLAGYRLTGERKYLDRAVFWARTGLPFLYAWQDPKMPRLMKYSSIAVFGTSFYTGLWFGRPVQWNGLDYAAALLDLAPFDPSFPWRQVAEGVTISGMNQQATRPDHYGLYTDNWDLTTNTECVGCMLSPGGILGNVFRLLGSPAQAGVDGVATADGWIAVNGPGRVSAATLTNGTLTAKVAYAAGASGYVAILPVTRPDSVSVDGKARQLAERGVPGDGEWSYSPRLGCVTLRVPFTGRPLALRVAGIRRKEPEFAKADWAFDAPDDPLGWHAASDLSAPVVAGGTLKMAVTGDDPYFVGPAIQVPAPEARGIALRARVSKPNGGFFWATDAGPISPKREVSFQLPADGQFHEAFVDLTSHPEWRGSIRQVRVDFAGGPGDTVEIEWIRVVPK